MGNIIINVLIKAKKTKFSNEKYNEKYYNDYNNNEINNKERITNFQWLIYANNSCIYDVFITFYIFCVFDYMNSKYDYLNDNIKNIHNLMRIIKDNQIQKIEINFGIIL